MALSTTVKFSFWALLVTLATCLMAEEIVYPEAGIAVKADETDDLFSRARRATFNGRDGFSAADKVEILQRLNSLRSQLKAANMQKMRWDENLEKLAQSHSNKCVFRHSSQQARSNVGGFKYVGENLSTTTGAFKPADIVQRWYDEFKDYNYNTNGCRPGKMCGHYTQLVWAESMAVGCAVKRCSVLGGVNWKNAYLITCQYGPGGNVKGQKPYKLGAVCSQCPANRRGCANNLCALESQIGSESSSIQNSGSKSGISVLFTALLGINTTALSRWFRH